MVKEERVQATDLLTETTKSDYIMLRCFCFIRQAELMILGQYLTRLSRPQDTGTPHVLEVEQQERSIAPTFKCHE
jgi:hypothetical protein